MDWNAPLTALPKIGEKTAKLFKKLDIVCAGDLLWHLPAYYRDLRAPVPLREIREGEEVLVRGRLTTPPRWGRRQGKFSVFSFEVADGTGVLLIHIFNLPFLFSRYKTGQEYFFYGKPKVFRDRMQMDNPLAYPPGETPGILPFYPLTAGISQIMMRRTVAAALREVRPPETFSGGLCAAADISGDGESFRLVHAPQTPEEYERGRRSMVYRELLVFSRMLALMDKGEISREALRFPENIVEEYEALLPFACTGAQRRVMEEIAGDLRGKTPMNRLVEGDVGSGKTAVALFAAYAAMQAGRQTVLMAPTELLAGQHFAFAEKIFGRRAALLRGSCTKAEREEVFARIAGGEVQVLVGTHAVLYHELPFPALDLVITDEQHRFGVGQRAALLRGNPAAHTLILTATPIPRTLSLVLYGKAKISLLDELPPGRKPVATHIVGQQKRRDMYTWLRGKLKEGEQAYVVCPLVEPSEGFSALSVEEVLRDLSRFFKGFGVEMLHGRMSGEEKREIMERFRSGATQVLVSTTVIEVGVDVPNASIMIVENADRFGLAQLHQLRGRVGRGDKESFCYLVSDGSGLERLRILKSTNDGFAIAEKDLELRGGGELTGQRQHGKGSLQVSNLVRDVDVLLETREMLERMPEEFPEDYAKATQLALEKIREGDAQVVLN